MKSYLKILFLFLLLLCVFSFNCATTGPKLSPMQIRQITTRQISGNYEDTYRSALTVLQDQGYIIKNTDMASGLITAQVDRESSTGSQITQALFLGYVSDKGSLIEVSSMVNKINETSTELRINIQETGYGQSSVWSGTSKQRVKQIYDPELYKKIFDQVLLEVKRRQALSSMSTQTVPNEIDSLNKTIEQSDSLKEDVLNSLLKEPTYEFLEVKNIVRNFVLVVINKDIKVKLNDILGIYRKTPEENIAYEKIGKAKVVQVQDFNLALEILESNKEIQIGDQIKYLK